MTGFFKWDTCKHCAFTCTYCHQYGWGKDSLESRSRQDFLNSILKIKWRLVIYPRQANAVQDMYFRSDTVVNILVDIKECQDGLQTTVSIRIYWVEGKIDID